MEKAGEEGIRTAIRSDTKLVWLEVPTNPLFLVPPLPLIAKIIASLPEESRPLVVVDTTFVSPFYCTPLVPNDPNALPLADVILTSLSKYSSGHSDIILGSLTLSPRTVSARPDLLKGLRFLQNSFGATPSPRDCHLMIRSLKTLGVRTLRHGLNALQIAAWLQLRPEVEEVRYIGLKTSRAFHMIDPLLSANARKELEYLGWSFPYRDVYTGTPGSLAHTRSLGIPFGGMLGFKLKGADEAQTERFMLNLRLVSLAESLGGVESLIEAPYGMTHAVSSTSCPGALTDSIGSSGSYS
jgi:cystathionine gamma-lyase